MSDTTWKLVYRSLDGLAVEETEQRPKNWEPSPTMHRLFQLRRRACHTLADIPQTPPICYRSYELTGVNGDYAFYSEIWSG